MKYDVTINGLSLFTGIGGLDVALSGYVRPIAYCEIDPYCQAVLLSRMADLSIHKAPIWDDIISLQSRQFNKHIDIIYGGFPCQDISIAGKGKGLAGERSGLFFEIIRLCSEIKPKFIFLENVPAITTRGGTEVGREIATLGYDCRWCIISAESIGALHKRERWFLLAYPMRQGLQNRQKKGQDEIKKMAVMRKCRSDESLALWQETVTRMDRITDGVPFQVDRVKSLGNAVVPAQAKEAFEILMGIKKTRLP